ncbi:hypothetical protein [Luteimonas fraxinea]|uniref:Uncharacterized protein n=1 Tax=Luteimonas fraxinea TaxID=2901869 RepID=A0ABS8UH50_9GAMM|nr:hypothetical protein [Luteimonas fraxinea]MCD9098066.1 hypothetical protein [Luteimonas fraxinea]
MRPWSKLPSWWFKPGDEALVSLQGGQFAGTSQAALRVYLGLAAAERKDAASFEVEASLSHLEELTQLSRVMVLRGIHRGVEAGLLAYAPGNRKAASNFTLVRADEGAGGWAKLPRRQVIERIPKLPHRGVSALVALKLYLILLAGRHNNNAVVALQHKTLRDKSGAQANQIRAGISLLAAAGLIHVVTEDIGADYQVQRYQIVGQLEAPRRWNETPKPGPLTV